MKQKVISNKFLENLCIKEQDKSYRNRLKKIKSSLSLNPPKFLTTTKDNNNMNKKLKTKTNRNNNIKLNPIKLNSFKKSFSSNNLDNEINKFKSNDLKLQIFNIAQENLNMYKKLLECTNNSSYDKKSLIKGYKKNQYYKKISCEYPSIDFFTKKRISNYYKVLNNKKTKLDTLFNNIEKYINPKTNDFNANKYEKLFFSNQVRKEYNTHHKKNRLVLNNLNMDNKSKKYRQYFKTFNGLVEKYENKKSEINKEENIKNADIITSIKEKKDEKKIENNKVQDIKS